MAVRRIVANCAAAEPGAVRDFYEAVFELKVAMDMGWIVTLAADEVAARPQISFLSEGGSGTPVPDISIEVDDVDEAHCRAVATGAEVVYPLTDEPWGVRRFYVRDPLGRILNVLSHLE